MSKRILITGGAGFIGSHLADDLLRHGYQVRALDCFCPQVHIDGAGRPSYLSSGVELLTGDLQDRELVRQALQGVDAVYHFAARVGVGQSMYQIADYTATETAGNTRNRPEMAGSAVKSTGSSRKTALPLKSRVEKHGKGH